MSRHLKSVELADNLPDQDKLVGKARLLEHYWLLGRHRSKVVANLTQPYEHIMVRSRRAHHPIFHSTSGLLSLGYKTQIRVSGQITVSFQKTWVTPDLPS